MTNPQHKLLWEQTGHLAKRQVLKQTSDPVWNLVSGRVMLFVYQGLQLVNQIAHREGVYDEF